MARKSARPKAPVPASAPPYPPQYPAYPPAVQTGHPPARRAAKRPHWLGVERRVWLLFGLLALFGVGGLCGLAALGVGLVYTRGMLPGVTVMGVPLGGMTREQAAQTLRAQFTAVTLRDGARVWDVDAGEFGLMLDVDATVDAAFAQGRSRGSFFAALSSAPVAPVIRANPDLTAAALAAYADTFALPPVNAGMQLVNGRISATPAQEGRALNVAATLARFERADAFAPDGSFALAMDTVLPAVTDAAPVIAQAEALLRQPFSFRIYDPVTGDSVYWDAAPETWAGWLAADLAPDGSLRLALNAAQVVAFLETYAAGAFDETRYLKPDEAAQAAQDALVAYRTSALARVYHRQRSYTVQAGETLTSIAWDFGIPYLYIQQLNGGISSVSAGQTIALPPADAFLLYPPVPDKRLVVSISQQRMWAYEFGALKWEWIISTGIASSPTWPGVYQVLLHEENAYAGNWNLWMPWFIGIYHPIPGADFTNGFHGFPTRGGSQLLWTNSLGTRVTYGCILVSNDNAPLLYDWATQGTVVVIAP